MSKIETDSRGRQWKTSKNKIECLADIMNAQSIHPLQTSDELFHIFDAALTGKEIDFLIKMGGSMYSRQRLMQQIGISEAVFDTILDSLIYKGPVAVIRDADNNKCYVSDQPIPF